MELGEPAAEPSPLTSDLSSQPSPLRPGHEGGGSPKGGAKREGKPEEKSAQLQNAEEGVRVGTPDPVVSQALDKDAANLDFIPALTLDKLLCLYLHASTPGCRLPASC